MDLKRISQCLYGYYKVINVSKGNLMPSVYNEKPACIILIESDLDLNSLRTIEATLLLEYIPTICVSFRKHISEVNSIINSASYIDGEQIETLLLTLVGQASQFSRTYNTLQMTYNTYEVMNEEIREALEIYVDPRVDYSEAGILQYIDQVYQSNNYLDNCPETIWLIKSVGNAKFDCAGYDLESKSIRMTLSYTDQDLSFDTFAETGFIKNEFVGELSDVASVSDIIPEVILRQHDVLENVACYAVEDIMIIGLNYSGKIGQMDLNILKAFTIKIDLMVTIKSKVSELEDSFVYTMNALARAAEGKDDITGYHIKRVNMFAKLIAKSMGKCQDFIDQIEMAAQMHDVGKILIEDRILNKPGKLTEVEFRMMQDHTVFGEKVIGESAHLSMASAITRYHHEKYDGSGYPDGIAGEAIPIEARIVALADVYDALRSARPYKVGFSHEEAYHIIVHGDGRVEPMHFDPMVLAVFKEQHLAFKSIYDSFANVE